MRGNKRNIRINSFIFTYLVKALKKLLSMTIVP